MDVERADPPAPHPNPLPSERGEGDRSSFALDLVLTALTQFIVLGGQFIQQGLVSRYWGIDDFSGYTLILRIKQVADASVLLLLPLAIARNVAMCSGKGRGRERRVTIWTGVGLCESLLLAFSGVVLLFPAVSATLLFGTGKMVDWTAPFAILFFGLNQSLVVFSVLQGLKSFRALNLLQLVCNGLIPVGLLACLRGRPLGPIVMLMGATTAVVALLFLGWLIARKPEDARPILVPAPEHKKTAATLLAYGVPRLSVIAAAGFLLAFLPWLVSRAEDPRLLSAVNVLTSVLTATAATIAPLGLLLLPHLASLLAEDKRDVAGRQVGYLLEFIIAFGTVGSLCAAAWLQPLIRLWLGERTGEIIGSHHRLLVAVSVALPGLLMVNALRNPIDAASSRPWNLASYGVGSVFAVGSFTGSRLLANADLELAVGLSMATGWTLGGLGAFLAATRLFDSGPAWHRVALPLAQWALLLTAGTAICSAVSSVGMRLALGFMLAALQMGLCIVLRPPWFAELSSRIKQHLKRRA